MDYHMTDIIPLLPIPQPPYRSLQNSHEAWRSLAISFCVGLVLLAAWFVLRRERRAADQAIAKATFHIWTELRFLVVFLCLLCLTVPMLAAADGYNWWYPDVIPYAEWKARHQAEQENKT